MIKMKIDMIILLANTIEQCIDRCVGGDYNNDDRDDNDDTDDGDDDNPFHYNDDGNNESDDEDHDCNDIL